MYKQDVFHSAWNSIHVCEGNITCMFEHLSIHPMFLSPVQLKPMGILTGQKYCKSQLNHLELKSTMNLVYLHTFCPKLLSSNSMNTMGTIMKFFIYYETVIIVHVWFQASSVVQRRSSLFWDVTQHRLVLSYQCFGTTYWSHLLWTAWPLKWGPKGCPETMVNNYQSMLCNMWEQ